MVCLTFGIHMMRTPLHHEHVALGARIIDFGGWEMPVQYTSITAEHKATRTGCGLFDVSHMGDLIFTGGKAEASLRRMLTNDVEGLPVGKGIYSHMLDEEGHIIDDLIVFHVRQGVYLMVPNAATKNKVATWVHGRLECCMSDASMNLGCVAVQGPKATEVLSSICNSDPDEIRRMHGAFVELKLPPGGLLDLAPEGKGLMSYVSRSGYTGEDGYEVLVEWDRTPEVWRALMATGKATPCGLGSRDTLRLEMGYLLSGTDFDGRQGTVETGPHFAVKRDHDFIGREALCAAKQDKALPRLTGFELLEKGIPRHGFEIEKDGRSVGWVTSGTLSPCLGKGIGLGYLPQGTKEGEAIDIMIRGEAVKARVAAPPFYKGACNG
jgi:aminomethyltransferase